LHKLLNNLKHKLVS